MLLVLLIHYVPTRTLPSVDSLAQNPLDTVVNLELRSLAFVCVNCFVLISGYFGIRWKWKSFSSLLFQILFWGVVACAVSVWAGWEESRGLGGFVHDLVSGWFIQCYIALYVIAPMLNSFVESVSQRRLGTYICLFYLFSTVFGWFLRTGVFNEGMSVMSLIGLYLIGAYLRKYKLLVTGWSPGTDFMVYLSMGFVMVAIMVVALISGVKSSIYGYLNPLVILASVYLFLCFSKLRIGSVKWINRLALSAFSVYLFHHHPMVEEAYGHYCMELNRLPWTGIFVIGYFAGIYLFCTAVDEVRLRLFRLLSGMSRLFHLK